MYTCPHCTEPTVALRQMLWASYLGRSTTCSRCGRASGLPSLLRWLHLIVALLFGVGIGVYCCSALAGADGRLTPGVAVLSIAAAIVAVPLGAAGRLWFIQLDRK
jgi:hypothetical protein